METFSSLLALCAGNLPVTGEFPSQRPVVRSFEILFALRLNKRLSKQSRGWDLRHRSAHHDVTVMGESRLVSCQIWLINKAYCRKSRCPSTCLWFNSLAPWKYWSNFTSITFKPMITNTCSCVSSRCEMALRRMPNLTNEKSVLVQVMVWCRQATSHYLSQCWHRYMSPYGVTRPQRVKCQLCCAVSL